MGITMAIVVDSMKRKNISTRVAIKQIVIRSMKLAALSLFLNNGHDLSEWVTFATSQVFKSFYMREYLEYLW